MRKSVTLLLAVCSLLWSVQGCRTNVEPSPEPGVLRITLKGADSDTTIIIQSDTSRFSRWDKFDVIVAQGRAYQGSDASAYIYNNVTSERKGSDTVNILGREWLNGIPITIQDTTVITAANSRFRQHVIFDSYVPPGNYTKISLSITASEMEIFVPKHYLNPVSLPPGVAPNMEFPASFTVNEQGVTEVQLEIRPYESLRRYRDQFLFERKVVVTRVTTR